MNQFIQPVLRPLARWAEHSQRQACSNALVASDALSAGRRERDEVETFIREFVTATAAGRQARSAAGASALHLARLG